MAARLEPTTTCQVLFAAGKHLVSAGRPLLYADSGIENINGAVDDTLFRACLERVLAQVEVTFSNSMIEALWRSLKRQWLYLNSLDSIERLRSMVKFYVEQHNTQMPHAAPPATCQPSAQRPEAGHGTRVLPPTARWLARHASSSKSALPSRGFPRDSGADAVAYVGVWNVPVRSCAQNGLPVHRREITHRTVSAEGGIAQGAVGGGSGSGLSAAGLDSHARDL